MSDDRMDEVDKMSVGYSLLRFAGEGLERECCSWSLSQWGEIVYREPLEMTWEGHLGALVGLVANFWF